jgi:large subunit ribosomal protein L28
MSRICQITGSKPRLGHRIRRSGLAKKKGGIGMHVTANTRRRFMPNLKRKKIFVPETGQFIQVRLTARALKTINKNGAYKTLLKAGLVSPKKSSIKKA